MCVETKNTGLRGIQVADTRISNIDGEKGKLIYRGYDILELTKKSNYEETAYLLLHDELPTKEQLSEFKSKLNEARWIPKRMQINMGNWRKDADPMDMLLDIGTIENVVPWIKEKMSKGERIMGMGHAVYKTYDPRAQVLKELSRKLAAKTGEPWYDITEKVETTTIAEIKMQKGKEIYPNVDLYSASIYYMLKIPMDLNTPIFAISRVAGWAAHIIEEKFAEAAP